MPKDPDKERRWQLNKLSREQLSDWLASTKLALATVKTAGRTIGGKILSAEENAKTTRDLTTIASDLQLHIETMTQRRV